MTLAELGKFLPNGFHDAELSRVEVNFTEARATFFISLDMEGDLDKPHDISRYRDAEIRLTGIKLLAMKGHEEDFNILNGPLDVCGSSPKTLQDPLIKDLPQSASGELYCFYVDDWNSCIYVAAETAELVWRPDLGFPGRDINDIFGPPSL